MALNNLPAAPATGISVVAPAAVPTAVPAHGPANWPNANSLTNLSGGERSQYRTKMQCKSTCFYICLSLFWQLLQARQYSSLLQLSQHSSNI